MSSSISLHGIIGIMDNINIICLIVSKGAAYAILQLAWHVTDVSWLPLIFISCILLTLQSISHRISIIINYHNLQAQASFYPKIIPWIFIDIWGKLFKIYNIKLIFSNAIAWNC